MKVNLRQIIGNWDQGWVLDKHILHSEFLGYNSTGHPQFDSTRTEAGEAMYQLKYNGDKQQAAVLAQAVFDHIAPKLRNIGFIVPMPASTQRKFQPVTAVAEELGTLLDVPVFDDLLTKPPTGKALKNISGKEEKIAALRNSLHLNVDAIANDGQWNVLLVDDLFSSGATMESACAILKSYSKVKKIYVAALTWSHAK